MKSILIKIIDFFKSINYTVFFSLFRKKFFYCVVYFIVGFIVFTILGMTLFNITYSSTSSIIIENHQESDNSIDNEYKKTMLTNTIVENSIGIIKSNDLITIAIDKSDLPGSPSSYRRNISVNRTLNSNILEITYRDKDSAQCISFTNSLTQTACEEIQRRYTDPPVIATVLNQASTPPAFQRTFSIVLVGFFGGLLGIIYFLMIIISNVRNDITIYSLQNFCKRNDLIFIGNVLSSERSIRGTSATLKSESIFNLKGSFKNHIENAKSVLFTSVSDYDERIQIPVDLVETLAESGLHVLYIEADLRKGRVRSRLRVDTMYGLGDVLRNRCKLQKAIGRTPLKTLDAICASTMPIENPGEYLDSKAMTSIFEAVKDIYDLIIIDCPPADLFSDAVSLCHLADTCVIIAEYSETKRENLEKIITNLTASGADVKGIIENGSPASKQ